MFNSPQVQSLVSVTHVYSPQILGGHRAELDPRALLAASARAEKQSGRVWICRAVQLQCGTDRRLWTPTELKLFPASHLYFQFNMPGNWKRVERRHP